VSALLRTPVDGVHGYFWPNRSERLMCGRYTMTDPDRLERAFGLRFHFEELSDTRIPPRFNVAPTQPVLGVKNGSANVELFRWGIGGRINARAETIGSRAQKSRCVLFADGFYEWSHQRPTYFTLQDGEPFAFAGIWSQARDASECAIITCEANDLVRAVHDRMPVILPSDALDVWLEEEALPADVQRALLRAYPAEAMAARPVSTRLNNARYDAPDILEHTDPIQSGFEF
jgi:putative SOS response-associated peptidase YedK